jgi:(2Fe-2S) ferredoxin
VLQDAFRAAVARHGAGDRAELLWQSCFGRCTQGPNVLVREIADATPTLGTGFATAPGGRGASALYHQVDEERVERIVREHVVAGRVVRDFVERAVDRPAARDLRYSTPVEPAATADIAPAAAPSAAAIGPTGPLIAIAAPPRAAAAPAPRPAATVTAAVSPGGRLAQSASGPTTPTPKDSDP